MTPISWPMPYAGYTPDSPSSTSDKDKKLEIGNFKFGIRTSAFSNFQQVFQTMQIKALIFDLDDTLYDCSNTISRDRRRELVGIVARYKGCSEEEALGVLQR